MNILVTGGAGFIGANFVKYMLGHYDYTIVNLDLLTYAGHLSNLKDVESDQRHHFIQGDITDQALVEDILLKYDIDAVINFAAESHVDRSIENPNIFLKTNVLGTQILLEAARRHWKTAHGDTYSQSYQQGKKFIQISTDEVYGTLGKDGYFTEKTCLAPNSPYSASKASADMLVRSYFKTYGLPVNITRCSNNYGPLQHPEKLIPLMIHNALRDQELPVYGDGKQVRDWLYVDDHCRAIDAVLHKGVVGEVYNIGGHNEKENIYIVKQILAHLIKDQKLIKHVEDRLGHDFRYAIDHTKITRELNWRPGYTFEEGLRKTIDWYLTNDDWLRRVLSGHNDNAEKELFVKEIQEK
ncbi:dTDP-glucose 4,6-dehydratase [Lentibacillus sp. JNUCC-1]|uniref:dTDP-glucose 4,6-dehydratase n=1 Tax=Lentibacillus sp. JNUCC-1 TaxID=2654513 RepID=UPI0012E94A95|nr:dTDP-glucose 4,6-dehydratase [Lentibacillus sp. JNUCC-1]MUV36926.1 dTDP-glucose 4,6-dehydratase [Lentibacillus sp. JNUCC-1]